MHINKNLIFIFLILNHFIGLNAQQDSLSLNCGGVFSGIDHTVLYDEYLGNNVYSNTFFNPYDIEYYHKTRKGLYTFRLFAKKTNLEIPKDLSENEYNYLTFRGIYFHYSYYRLVKKSVNDDIFFYSGITLSSNAYESIKYIKMDYSYFDSQLSTYEVNYLETNTSVLLLIQLSDKQIIMLDASTSVCSVKADVYNRRLNPFEQKTVVESYGKQFNIMSNIVYSYRFIEHFKLCLKHEMLVEFRYNYEKKRTMYNNIQLGLFYCF